MIAAGSYRKSTSAATHHFGRRGLQYHGRDAQRSVTAKQPCTCFVPSLHYKPARQAREPSVERRAPTSGGLAFPLDLRAGRYTSPIAKLNLE
jgi:hypothetical protein